MNILILSWRGPKHPHAGGAEIVTHEHAKAWIKKGYQVTLFTSYFPGAKSEETIDGVKIIRRGGQVLGVQMQFLLWYLFQNQDKYDLVVDQFHGLPFFSPLFVKEKKLAFIHEVAKNVWSLNPWPKPFNLLPALLGPLIEPLIFKYVYHQIPFMVVSESTRDDLMEWEVSKKNIFIVHNGVNLVKLEKIPPKEKKFTVTFLGALSQDKGIEFALDTFEQLEKLSPKAFNFWVIGGGEEKYLILLEEINKRVSVKYWGFVNEQTKFKLLSRSHILLNPSLREGWGLVVIEAASVGVPTVGFKVAGIKDSVLDNKTGLLAGQISSTKLAENVIKLKEDKKLYQKLQKNCLKRSKQFSWNSSTKKSLQLIKHIAQR